VTLARAACLLLAAGTIGLASGDARADQPRAKDGDAKSPWRKLRAGADLVDTAPNALVLDGMWSFSTTIATSLTNRTWDAPYPWGTIGQYSTRLLYGMSWTLMLGVESLIVVAANGGSFDWLAEASYRTDWMIGTDLPACPRPGAYGGCGVGVGNFSFVSIRPLGRRWWWEAGGGWIQQRVYNDQYRTVAESSWVLTPISAFYDLKTDPDAPVALRLFAGPGVYFGLHNGHMHPTLQGERDKGLSARVGEMYLLDGGIGPGGRAEARVTFFRRVALEGELIMAPFLLGGPTSERPSRDIAPLDFEREGMSVWRKLTGGIAYVDPKWPLKPTLGFFAAELSDRPVEKMGHRGVMIRFDLPLRTSRGND
jgi:hypothetical protein